MTDSPILCFNSPYLNAVSAATSTTSNIIDATYANYFAVQTSWTGTAITGTMNVQVSLDQVNWSTIYSKNLTGNSGLDFSNLGECAAPYFQIQYIATSGTGTVTVKLCGKQ